jgi:hypothetical protein
MNVKYITVIFFAFVTWAQPQAGENEPQQSIPLTVPASVPLRVYLTKRVPKKVGAPVEAKLLEGVYAFDRQVIPPGTQVLGHVSRLEPVSKFERTKAVLGGDFTPLHRAEVEFTSLRLADGREIPVQTQENIGLNSIFVPKPPSKKAPKPQTNTGGVLGTGKQMVQDQINTQIDRVRSIPDMVRAPNKMERLSDYFMAKLPYHPQFVRNGTRFDAELRTPLDFGSTSVTRSSMLLLGTQPAAESLVHARLITPLDSSTTKPGQQVDAVLSEPLFSSDHKLVLPEGTRLSGSVVMAQKARLFHRTGKLRFNFQNVDLPEEAAQLKFPAPESAGAPPVETPGPAVETEKVLRFRSQAILKAAESDQAPVKVDSEGGVKTTESKTRFIKTAIAVLIASKSGDTDAGHLHGGGGGGVGGVGQNGNVSGRTLGGGLGFGLVGTALSQSSKYVGMAFGYYGLGWSVFSTVIARGQEVQFDKNAVIDVGFNPRTATTAKK